MDPRSLAWRVHKGAPQLQARERAQGKRFPLELTRGQLARNTYRQVPEVYTFTYVKGELY